MKKIIIAGSGHGGLTASIHLAKHGFDVTVFEKEERENLGYDWHDCIPVKCFQKAGIEPMPSRELEDLGKISYFSPSKRVLIENPKKRKPSSMYVHRKALIRHLISIAEQSGVKLVFGERVDLPVVENDCVKGIVTQKGTYYCDLVIDSLGCGSSLRRNLPEKAGIVKEILPEETLYTFRGYYRHNGKMSFLPKYCAYFYHNSNKGFDWVINGESYVDILVGSFGKISEETTKNAVEDFCHDHCYLENELICGGKYCTIPLRRVLPVFVYNGYALVGDSASMTEPLSGSGIGLSMEAGRILAETVINASDYKKESLWEYNRLYLEKHLKATLNSDVLKNAMMTMGADSMNKLFEKKVMTYKEICGTGKQSLTDILSKIYGVATAPEAIPVLLKMGIRLMKIQGLIDTIPKRYSSDVKAWAEKYEAF